MHQSASHFKGKDASTHVHEAKAEGVLEAHGGEPPGHIGAFADAMREVAFLLLLLFVTFWALGIESPILLPLSSIGLILWKTGRRGWLGWVRLERLHRLINQEKYEIEHHREQEREELIALYAAKGFEGKLLHDVVDHLMNDSDRLLKVMLEEEMGLNLEMIEHPLKLALGAFLGSLLSAAVFILFFIFFPFWGPFLAAFLLLGGGALLTAFLEGNRFVNALIWTIAIATLSVATTYFLIHSLL